MAAESECFEEPGYKLVVLHVEYLFLPHSPSSSELFSRSFLETVFVV